MYFGVVAPGKWNDNATYPLCVVLKQAIESLPLGLYFVGDAAYSNHENLLVPFIGAHQLNLDNDAFDFHFSQIRKRIEMAFGRLTNKFRILKPEIDGLIHNRAAIVMGAKSVADIPGTRVAIP